MIEHDHDHNPITPWYIAVTAFVAIAVAVAAVWAWLVGAVEGGKSA